MSEGSRGDIPAANPQYPQGANEPQRFRRDNPLPGMPTGRNLLPARSVLNRRLNRSAERIGHGVGAAVAGVRTLPRRFDVAGSRLHVVSSRVRQNAAATAFELMDSAAQRAGNWRDSAEAWLLETTERADRNWNRLSEEAGNRLQHLQYVAAQGVERAGARAQQHIYSTGRRLQRWEEEEPLQVLATIAGVAFVAGAVIRVWRSSRD